MKKVGKSRNRSIEVDKQVDILTQSIETQPEKQKTEQKLARLSPEINIKLSFGGKGKEFTIGLDPKELNDTQNTDSDHKGRKVNNNAKV